MQPALYKHSGRGVVSGLLFGFGLGLPASMLLGALYSALIFYIPFAGYITLLLAFGFGFASAFATSLFLGLSRSRNVTLPFLLILINALLGYGFAWVVWTWLFLQNAGVDTIMFSELLLPWNLLAVIVQINANGAWTMMGATPTGGVLWALWAIEAALVLGTAFFIARQAHELDPYCEECGTWCTMYPDVIVIPGKDSADLTRRLRELDLSVFKEPCAAPGTAVVFHQILFFSCPNCGNTQTMSLHEIIPTYDDQGNRTDSPMPLIQHMLVTKTQIKEVYEAAAAPPLGSSQDDAVTEDERESDCVS